MGARRSPLATSAGRRSTFPAFPALLAAGVAFAFPFAVGVVAWPEVVTPAYFVTRGSLLYRDVFFPHTPLLILLTAAGGSVFGFGAALLRAIPALSLAATALLVVAGTRPLARSSGAWSGLLLGTPLVLLLSVYHEGPALWPDPFMAPLVLGAGLLLERFERGGSERSLAAAGLLLGLAVLVKQTSAWIPLAAAAWLALASRRRGLRPLLHLLLSVALPYLVFTFAWGAAFGTLSHVRWTLLVPIRMGLARDNRDPYDLSDIHEALAPFLGIVALALARWALPARTRLRSAVPWLALGCLGMGYPRADLLHISASLGLNALLLSRTPLVLALLLRRGRRRSPRPVRTVAFALGGAALASSAGVLVLGGGALALDRVGGPVRYWDDGVTLASERVLRKRVKEGDRLLLYCFPYDTLYARTGTLTPDGLYVNTFLWDCINKEGADAKVASSLARAAGTPVLFREPALPELRRTAIYRFVTTRTDLVEVVDERTSWRRIDGPAVTGPGGGTGGGRGHAGILRR